MSESESRIPLFERLKVALEEGIKFAKGNQNLLTTLVPEHPPALRAEAIRQLRQLAGMTQLDFAQVLHVSTKTVRSWEQGTRQPSQRALRFLYFLNQNQKLFYGPSAFANRVKQAKEKHDTSSRASKIARRKVKTKAS